MKIFGPSRALSRLAVSVSALCLVLSAGCGGGGGNGPTDEELAAQYTADGWEVFEAGDIETAQGHFEDALEKVDTWGDAYLGLGWCLASDGDYLAADTTFDLATLNGVSGADPEAGKAAALRDITPPDYAGAIAAATSALAAAPSYQFTHGPSFDWRDLRLILAQSSFALADYATANDQVGLLGGDEQNEESETFVEDLLRELEDLGAEISG